MKTTIKISILSTICLMIVGISTSYAQTAEMKTETFKVYGNCGMCKEKIEGALKKKDGVTKKNWDTKTKMISVSYDPAKISLQQIKQKIADAGYDTDDLQAKADTYNKLDKCCQYDRPKAKQ
jgi:mercuric ion binding protein